MASTLVRTSLLLFVLLSAISVLYLLRLERNDRGNKSYSAETILQFEKAINHYNTTIDWNMLRMLDSDEMNVDWEKVPRLPSPPKEEMHDKWIVVTTISAPTEDVKKLATLVGWKVVVVGDTKTPVDWSVPGIVYLSVEKQQSLGYHLTKVLPFKTYTRKNIGYLYAIHHGAKIIYETDDDNHPSDGLIFHQSGIGDFLVYKAEQGSFINVYEHFGQTSIWPRGFPLNHIMNPPHREFYKCKNVRPLVQQGLVNGDPDVDAVFRLTRKDGGVNLDLKFDANSPVVLLPPGGYCPYNSQNTLHMYEALWGLILVSGINWRATDIWRSYWAQRLLNEINGYVSFFPPNAYQFRNAHDYLFDFKEEKQLYYQASEFVEYLHNWKSKKQDFFTMVLQLSIDIAKMGFIKLSDAVEVEAWLLDLVSMGYKIPPLNKIKYPCEDIVEQPHKVMPKEQPSSYLRLGKVLKNIYT